MAKNSKQILTELLKGAGVTVNGSKPYDIQVHDERFYKRVFSHASLGIGESYMDGWWDCDDLAGMLERVHRAHLDAKLGISWPVIKMALRAGLGNMQSKTRSRRNAQAHYDMGNDFYTAMLDTRMIYSCGYWKEARNLDQAQEAKLDLICRKLHLKKGMTVLDIGCGWGGFATFAARKYGVKVTAITPAVEQVKVAKERAKGLDVSVLQKIYQEMTGDKKFDAIVSIGTLEHVGNKNWQDFFDACKRLLKPNGIMLHHTIGANQPSTRTDPWIDKYIFPGGVVPSLSQLTPILEKDWIIEDVQNIGPDYVKTLAAWHKNFEKNYPKLKDKYDERFHRMGRYYLCFFEGMFRARKLQLWQFVMTNSESRETYRRVS